MCENIAQLGERQTEDLKVTGSIPVILINIIIFLQQTILAYPKTFSSEGYS